MKRTRRDFIGTNATAGRQRPELSVSRHCTLRNLGLRIRSRLRVPKR
jgi:hypothetical protein